MTINKKEGNLAIRHWALILLVAIGMWSSAEARKYASIVIDADTGIIHHQANSDATTYPASMTKMMTLYLVFQALRDGRLTLNQPIRVSKHASRQAPCKLWLKPGSTITVKQAIQGMVTKSANDASVAVAEALASGSETRFAQKMTQQARKIGLKRTVFKNASGLPHSGQITTAREMAALARALYRDFPEYYQYFKQRTFSYKGKTHKNHNQLLGKVKGLDGIKTGYINASGFNLAASVIRGERRIIAVVMGGKTSKSRDRHMTDLLERTYKQVKNIKDKAYMTMNDLVHSMTPGYKPVRRIIGRRHRVPPLPPVKDVTLYSKALPTPAPIKRVPSPLAKGGSIPLLDLASMDQLITKVDETYHTDPIASLAADHMNDEDGDVIPVSDEGSA